MPHEPRRITLAPGEPVPQWAVLITRSTPWGNPWTITTTLQRDPWTGEHSPGRYTYRVDNADTGHHERVETDEAAAHRTAARLYHQVTLPERLSQGLDLSPLQGRSLACYCPGHLECHGDRLLRIAAAPDPITEAQETRP